MTNKEAKEKLYMEWQKFLEDNIDYAGISDAYKTAFKSLEQEPKTDSWSIKDVADTFKKHGLIREQEPCEDAIDRKLVCAFIAGLISDDGEREKGLEYIRSMPPVNPTKTGWIPVSERLPKKDRKHNTFLVTDSNGNLSISKFYLPLSNSDIDKPYWSGMIDVIAWMPLPKPYEPQERSGEE